jgi:hypothetical protein
MEVLHKTKLVLIMILHTTSGMSWKESKSACNEDTGTPTAINNSQVMNHPEHLSLNKWIRKFGIYTQ